jgi:hypothetical protein
MRYLITIFICAIILSSCRKDFESSLLTSGELAFSKDTVYLDTVFTNIGSSTYNLKVYNKSNKNISIPSIKLGRGTSSFYRLNVDGKPGKEFQDVEILAKDSLYIFIETTIDYTQVSNPIYTDAIVFDSGLKIQDVNLVTLVKDAHFLYPSKSTSGLVETIKLGIDADGNDVTVQGFYLNGNTTFNNEKPYVVYGYCGIQSGNTLSIEAGTNIHFHANSGILVEKNATLNINGTLNEKVILEGDRLEPQFSEIPGQWGAVWLRAGSKNNTINHTLIKNASVGIISDSINGTNPSLTIKNTEIYNSSSFGILGRETNIYGENVVINNSGQSSLACTIGGTYNFIHSTFANYWNNSLRDYPTVLINNFFTYNDNGTTIAETRDLLKANFTNCIIDGSNQIELIIDKIEGAGFNYNFSNNLIKFNDIQNSFSDIPEYNFEDLNHFQNNIINGESHFKNPYLNQLIIGQNSDGINQGSINASTIVPLDILGVTRTRPADIGAYQHIILE